MLYFHIIELDINIMYINIVDFNIHFIYLAKKAVALPRLPVLEAPSATSAVPIHPMG